MDAIPGNRAVAFRMPCCDSLNTPSPRFYAEIFNQTHAAGQLPDDRQLGLQHHHGQRPRAAARAGARRARPQKSFATTCRSRRSSNTIEDYPYPYVIGRLCWEFPCVVPSDWSAQNLQKPNNPQTVARLQEGPRRHGRQAGRLHPGLPSAQLDQERADRRADRPRGGEARQEGQVPQLSRGPGAARTRTCSPASRCARPTAATTACGCST